MRVRVQSLLPCIFSYCCSKRPWSLFLGIFVINAILGPLLPILFGRITEIETFISVRVTRNRQFLCFLIFEQNQQRKVYSEVLIAGDLSQDEINHMAIFQSNSYDVSGLDATEFVYGDETVYFAQPSPSQFAPGGSGAGSFKPASFVLKGPPDSALATDRHTSTSDTSMVLRYAPPAR